MKIAIPMYGDNISLHYGHSEGYVIYEIDSTNHIVNSKKVMNGGIKGCEAAALLSELNVDTVITGGIGENAKRNLERYNIQVLVGASGNLDRIIDNYINGTLDLDDTQCHSSEEHHHHDHDCCGNHSHNHQ